MADGEPATTIGVLAPTVGGYYFGGFITAIAHAAEARGARVVAIQTLDAGLEDGEHLDGPDFSTAVGWARCAGYITVSRAAERHHLSRLLANGTPVVSISADFSDLGIPEVTSDNERAMRPVVDHLVAHGHRRIAFVANLHQTDMRERRDGYLAAMAAHGLTPDPSWLIEVPDNMEAGGRVAAKQLLAAGMPVTAIVLATDLNAMGCVEELHRAGLHVPDDVAVVGFDDLPPVARMAPAIASVNQRFDRLSELAVQLLFDKLAGVDVSGVHRSPATFMPRESCGCRQEVSVPGGVRDADPRALLTGELRARLHNPHAVPSPLDDRRDATLARCVDQLVRYVDAAVTGAPLPGGADVARLADDLYALRPRRETAANVIACVRAYVDRSVDGRTLDVAARRRIADAVVALALALPEAVTRDESRTSEFLDSTMKAQYGISMRVLRSASHDPRNLAWLSMSIASTGVLALWHGGPGESCADTPLDIVGVFDRHDRWDLSPLLGRRTSSHHFPPVELERAVDAAAGEVVFVIPVTIDASNWGLLAVTGPVEQRSLWGRNTLNYWSALLAVALDELSLLESLRAKGAELEDSVARERDLVRTLKISEERYALAMAATSDGLWDWDVDAGTAYFSPRWSAMLGYGDGVIGDRPDEWFDRVHPDDLPALQAAIAKHLRDGGEPLEHEHRVRAADGAWRWMLLRALAVDGDNGHRRVVGSLADVTQRRELEDQLRHGALHDALTGLPNRTLFYDRLSRAIVLHARRPDLAYAVLFLDLDGFKVVNDSLGHHNGDALLGQVAQRASAAVREADTVARFGGDEFAVLLSGVDLATVPRIALRLQGELARPFTVDGHQVVVTASVGIATSDGGYASADDVLRDADIAMYSAKSTQRSSYAFFDVGMREGAVRRLRTELELRRAIDGDALEVHYQPIVDLRTRDLRGLEALIRWRHPVRGLVSPAEFLPIAEETGLILPLGRRVLSEVCRHVAGWRADGVFPDGLRVSVNVSHREFWHGRLLESITRTLARAGLDTSVLAVEITEGVIVHNIEEARDTLESLHDAGLQLHVDDFGTGYSSLAALLRFPIDTLKVDRSFVAGLENDDRSRELIRTIVAMGASLGVGIIAEGVETEAQREALVEVGGDRAQGYLFARPMPADEVTPVLRAAVAEASAAVTAAAVPLPRVTPTPAVIDAEAPLG